MPISVVRAEHHRPTQKLLMSLSCLSAIRSLCTVDGALKGDLQLVLSVPSSEVSIMLLTTVLQRSVKVFLCFSDSVMVLLRELGRGYLALCSYNCREAINILTSLPPQHYNTGWVLTHIGRAYFELAEYTQVSPDRHQVSVHTLFWI